MDSSKLSELFRFPEEAELEQRLAGLSKAEICDLLARWHREIPPVCPAEPARAEAIRELERLEHTVSCFLKTAHGQTDVFGAAKHPAQLYAEYCAFQLRLQQSVSCLRGGLPAHALPYTLPPDRVWILQRLISGADHDPELQEAAQRVLQAAAKQRAAQAAEDASQQRLEEYVKRLLEQTVPAYCDRALVLSDARGNGEKLQAGALLALTAELGEAVRAVLQGINYPDARKNCGKGL